MLTVILVWILLSNGEQPLLFLSVQYYLTSTFRFSTVPPGVRSYVGGALAVAASGPSAGSNGDFISKHLMIALYFS